MAQPAQIAIVEGPQIGDAVFQHRHPLDPHAKREALILRGVDAAILPAPWDAPCRCRGFRASRRRRRFQPAAGARAADIDLGRGLGEREIARPEAHRQIVEPEKGAAELDQAAFQMAHMRRPVDDQPLDLMEHRRMRRVMVAAKGAARHDDADRRLLRQHRADLHRRGMRAQHQPGAVGALGQVEGVVLLPRRMLGRDVERGEIVEILFDMRPLGDDKAHLAKDRDDLVDGLADRMDAALAGKRHRQGHVGALGGEPLFERRPAEPLRRFGERRGDPVLGGVQFGAGAPPRVRDRAPPAPASQGSSCRGVPGL